MTYLHLVSVTDDIELIDKMFSRLNEAVPLNAPEKRNAFPGTLPKTIREVAEHPFFTSKVSFSDTRYKHRDLAAKYLMIERKDAVVDTKKVYLDQFVKVWAREKRSQREADKLRQDVEVHLNNMAKVFADEDSLLQSIGMAILIFHFFRLLNKNARVDRIRREHFQRFEDARKLNRVTAELDIAEADYDLLEFDKYVQTPNDSYATRLRLSILIKFMRSKLKLDLPKPHDGYFDPIPEGQRSDL